MHSYPRCNVDTIGDLGKWENMWKCTSARSDDLLEVHLHELNMYGTQSLNTNIEISPQIVAIIIN